MKVWLLFGLLLAVTSKAAQSDSGTQIITIEPKKFKEESFELVIKKPEASTCPDCQVCIATALLSLNPDTLACVLACLTL
jgi:hypothetical protein